MAGRIEGMGAYEQKDREAAKELGLSGQASGIETSAGELVEKRINSRTRRNRIRRDLFRHPEQLIEDYWH